MTNEAILDIILKACKDFSITAYEISKHTKFSAGGVQKILDGKTKKPNRQTLLTILDFLESRIVGSKLAGHKNYREPSNEVEDQILKVQEEVESYYKKVPINEIFSDVGTELLVSFKKQIQVHELVNELFKKNTAFMEQRIEALTSGNSNGR